MLVENLLTPSVVVVPDRKTDPIFDRLEHQIDWYDRKSRSARRMYKRIKVVEILSAATYRSTCEALKHEKYVYLASAGPYTNATAAHALLAERIESTVSQEHAQWSSVQQQAAKAEGTATTG